MSSRWSVNINRLILLNRLLVKAREFVFEYLLLRSYLPSTDMCDTKDRRVRVPFPYDRWVCVYPDREACTRFDDSISAFVLHSMKTSLTIVFRY